ncbi:MAG TPA: hypothetical protein PKG48_13800, partial [Bacteroidales bacterium]|nr:hypothetical protein [Bacteroidales bacterium]
MRFPGTRFLPVLLPLIFFLSSHEGLATKYYSYQSGYWNGSNVWTTDSTGTTLVGSATPVSNDIVCILTGRTITASANITTTGHTLTIEAGAYFDLQTYTFTSVILNGQGKIRTARTTLPTISSGTFLGLNGGTVEFYAASGSFSIDPNVATYCHLLINLGSVTQVVTVARSLTLYGSLTIQKGTFQIGDATTNRRSITVGQNVTVGSNGKITTGTGNPNSNPTYSINSEYLPPIGTYHNIFHQLIISGDFTNNGTVRFTNLTAPNYGEFANNGAVTVRFTGESDRTVTLNGITDFYNLVVDKGIDQTYTLTINSSNINNFSLYGPNALRRNTDAPFSLDYPEVRKALWIKAGTLRLTGSILIPTLAEGPSGDDGLNGDYAIGLAAQLWLDGPDVAVYSTA